MTVSPSQGRDWWFSAQPCTTCCQKQHKTTYESQKKLKEKRLRSRSTERYLKGILLVCQKLCFVSGQNNEETICLSTLFWRPWVKSLWREFMTTVWQLKRRRFRVPDAGLPPPRFPAITTQHLPERGSGERMWAWPQLQLYLERHWTLLVGPFSCASVLFPRLFMCLPGFECILFNKETLASWGFCSTGVSQHSAGRWNQYFTKPQVSQASVHLLI